MKHFITLFFCFGLSVACYSQPKQQQTSLHYPYRPVPFTQVKVNDGLWLDKIKKNSEITIPISLYQSLITGRIQHFYQAAHPSDTIKPQGKYYDDSDVFKIIEGIGYSLQTFPNSKLENYTDSIIDLIEAAQEADGYLYTFRTMNPKHPTSKTVGTERWKNVERGSHELYNQGHLIEGAIAYYQATGKDKLLKVAIKSADCICRAIGPGENQLKIVPGHEELELALCKLYLVTGDKKYLDEALFFIDMRGKTEVKSEYTQSDKPLLEQTTAIGHAVRAMYLYCGAVDVAALTNNREYIEAIDRIWDDLVRHQLYLTGGIGSSRKGEAFGLPYNLINKEAYNETCASIGLVFLNQRLFQLHGDAKYIDVLERTLYNALLAGVSLTGDHFFYPNPLASDGGYLRSPWFGTACCPSNICRFMPSLPGYIYAVNGRDLYVNMFLPNNTSLDINGKKVELAQQTKYPWEGDILLEVKKNQAGIFAMKIRIPGWALGQVVPSQLYSFSDNQKPQYAITVNNQPVQSSIDKGYFTIERKWRTGDKINIHFDIPVRSIVANEKLKEDNGLVAFQRGPIVYCAESIDNPDFNNFLLPYTPEWDIRYDATKLDGITELITTAQQFNYDQQGFITTSKRSLTLIPYYSWSNRGDSKMAVWLPWKVEKVITKDK